MPQDQWKLQGDYKPWYVGWTICDENVADIFKQNYEIPFFLPEDLNSDQLEWIFMGTPGFGATLHRDNIKDPTWQVQVLICDYTLVFLSTLIRK